jgi:hypothetical protein
MFGIILGVVFAALAVLFWIMSEISYDHDGLFLALGFVALALAAISFVSISFTGVVNYRETNDYDRARITAVDTIQTSSRTYYKVDVEYLTNTPTTDGIITNYNIEKDTYYAYEGDLIKKLRDNMYKEVIITSGYKGGYETWKDFRDKLIKDIKLLDE